MSPGVRGPLLPPGACHVWWAAATAVPQGWEDVLGTSERTRVDRFAFEADRRRYVVAHVLARRVLGIYVGAGAADLRFVAVCPRCGGPHGKPALLGAGAGDVDFSISHSGDWAVVAVARGMPVGVDVERIEPSIVELAGAGEVLTAVERRVVDRLPAAERPAAIVRYWVRKEAALKASGDGLAVPPGALTVSPPRAPAAVLSSGPPWTAGPVRLRDLAEREGYAASVAFLGDAAPVAVERDGVTLLAPDPRAPERFDRFRELGGRARRVMLGSPKKES
ncbi:MAG: 4'-phosphopantetheinyl transferase family protein [Actinomycetota bacterium]